MKVDLEHSPLGGSSAEGHVRRHPTLPIFVSAGGSIFNLKMDRLKTRFDKDGYALVDCGPRGKRKTVRVHRVVMATFDQVRDSEVDHINRNRADNRLANLRYAAISENRRNVGTRHDSASGIRNVRWREDKKRWQAYCHSGGRFKHLAYVTTLEEAKTIAETRYVG